MSETKFPQTVCEGKKIYFIADITAYKTSRPFFSDLFAMIYVRVRYAHTTSMRTLERSENIRTFFFF